MYKIVIIDDEPMVYRGLSEKINWHAWGCTVVGTASDGIEGKQLIEEVQPNIVVSDIKMPGMDGLELAQETLNQYPDTKFILLSGFNDFQYARQAIRNNIFDYLLKPVSKEELEQTIRRAIAAIENNQDLLIKKNQADEAIMESEWILKLLNGGKIDCQEISKGWVLAFQWEPQTEKEKDQPQRRWITETFRRNKLGIKFFDWDRQLIGITYAPDAISKSLLQTRIHEAVSELIESIRIQSGKRILVGVGDFFEGLSEIQVSYKSALNMLRSEEFWGINEGKGSPVKPSSVVIPEELYVEIAAGNGFDAVELFKQTERTLAENRNIDLVYSTYVELLIQISNISVRQEIQYDFSQSISQLYQLCSFSTATAFLKQIIQSVSDIFYQQIQASNSNFTDNIKRFIQEHAKESGISLQYVSERFYLSSSYLSRLFKKETGINFNDYSSMIRVEMAKKVLAEKYWISNRELAFEVGFTDGKYFGQVFKKLTGLTLTEYRQSMRIIPQ